MSLFKSSRVDTLALKCFYLENELERQSKRYYELSRKHDELATALGMVHDSRSVSRYVVKGRPEYGE